MLNALLKLSRHISGFVVSTILLTILSLIVVPAMVNASGLEAWSYIALGQGIGVLFAAIIWWDWGVAGPTRIANLDEQGRQQEFKVSLQARGWLFLLCIPAELVIAFSVNHVYWLETFVGLVFSASIGLTAVWFFAGVGRPKDYFLFEITPRCLGACVAIACMDWGGASAWFGVIVQLLGMLFAALVCASRILSKSDVSRFSTIGDICATLWSRKVAFSRTLLITGYSALPIAMVGFFIPGILGTFAVYDKIFRQLWGGLQPFVSGLQGVFPRYMVNVKDGRRAVAGSIGLAFLAGAVAVPLTLVLVPYFSAGELSPSQHAVGFVAVGIGAGLVDMLLANSIMPILGAVRLTVLATVVSIFWGVPAIILFAGWWGVEGAIAGLSSGICVRACLQVAFAWMQLGRTTR